MRSWKESLLNLKARVLGENVLSLFSHPSAGTGPEKEKGVRDVDADKAFYRNQAPAKHKLKRKFLGENFSVLRESKTFGKEEKRKTSSTKAGTLKKWKWKKSCAQKQKQQKSFYLFLRRKRAREKKDFDNFLQRRKSWSNFERKKRKEKSFSISGFLPIASPSANCRRTFCACMWNGNFLHDEKNEILWCGFCLFPLFSFSFSVFFTVKSATRENRAAHKKRHRRWTFVVFPPIMTARKLRKCNLCFIIV